MKKHFSNNGANSEIDLTPMLDVVFIMLIFFIVTASFLTEKSLDMAIAPKNHAEQIGGDSLVFNINNRNEIYSEQRRLDPSAVRAIIAQQIAANPATSVMVLAHEHSSVEVYVAILDAAKQARISPPSLKIYRSTRSLASL